MPSRRTKCSRCELQKKINANRTTCKECSQKGTNVKTSTLAMNWDESKQTPQDLLKLQKELARHDSKCIDIFESNTKFKWHYCTACHGVTIKCVIGRTWDADSIKECWDETKNKKWFKDIGHILFEDAGKDLVGVDNPISFAEVALQLHLEPNMDLRGDIMKNTNHLGLLFDIIDNVTDTSSNNTDGSTLVTTAMETLESGQPVLAFFSPLVKAKSNVKFAPSDAYYPKDRKNQDILRDSYAYIHKQEHTGTHADTISKPGSQRGDTNVGKKYKEGDRAFSDAFGILHNIPSPPTMTLPPTATSTDDSMKPLIGKIFIITLPPSKYEDVANKIQTVLETRLTKEKQRLNGVNQAMNRKPGSKENARWSTKKRASLEN